MIWIGFFKITSGIENALVTILTKRDFCQKSVKLSMALKFNVYLNLGWEGSEWESYIYSFVLLMEDQYRQWTSSHNCITENKVCWKWLTLLW